MYVDDLLLTDNDLNAIQEAQHDLHQHFKVKDLGELRYFLGIEFARSKEGIAMYQRKYALGLISELGLAGSKPKNAPLEQHVKLTNTKYDAFVENGVTDLPLEDMGSYQRLIGKLLYLTITRPDISFSVQCLSQFMSAPKQSYYEAALNIVRYIKKQPGLGLLMPSTGTTQVTASCDSDWASCPMFKRSVTGYCVKFGSSLISWKSKKQSTVSKSSAEAEYRSMENTVSELVWIAGLLKELKMKTSLLMELFCDNKAALQIAANPMYHERTKHIEIDCHFIRDKIQEESRHHM